jgi:uncharacterized protein (TIGR02145 family)
MRVSLLVVAMLSAFLWSGCGGEDNPSGGGNNGGNNGGGSGTYDFVELGGLKWMKKNLNIQTANSWCYGNDPANCTTYGRLYTGDEAKTICPAGWRLPTREDWNGLVEYAGGESVAGKKLKAASGWNDNPDGSSGNGTDDYEFSALPGGDYDPLRGFEVIGTNGGWWTATVYGPQTTDSYVRHMNRTDATFDNHNQNVLGRSVRCVKQ